MTDLSEPTERKAAVQARSHSGPNIVQAFVWGIFAAIFASVFGVVGKILSDNPSAPTLPDSLHGKSSLAELRKYAADVLSNAPAVLKHDEHVIAIIGVGIIILCVLAVAATVFFFVKTRPLPIPRLSFRFAGYATCMLALTPFIFSILMPTLQPLQGEAILDAIGNSNTHPSIVAPGETVKLKLPTSLQSFQGVYRSVTFSIGKSEAELPDGHAIPVQLGDTAIQNGGEKRGKTDVIPLMENVNAWLIATLPTDSKLTDALVKVNVSGTLALIASNQYDFTGSYPYQTSTSFRVSGEREHMFYNTYTAVAGRIQDYRLITFGFAGILIFALCAFRAKILFAPSPPKPADGDGTALVWASRYGFRDVVRGLLDKRVEPNAKDADGLTALIWASVRGYPDVVKALLDQGANVNAKASNGVTALIQACKGEHGRGAGATRNVVMALLDKGADPNATDAEGITALMRASRSGDEKIVNALLDKGADVNARANNGLTALILASVKGSSEVVKALLGKGAEVDVRDSEGDTAISVATKHQHSNVRALLVQSGSKQ